MKYPELLLLTGLMVGGLVYAENQNPNGGGRPQMDAATKAKFEACATEAGMPARDSGTRPTKEQHEAFKACLTKAGVSMPEHHGRHGGGRPDEGAPPPEENNN